MLEPHGYLYHKNDLCLPFNIQNSNAVMFVYTSLFTQPCILINIPMCHDSFVPDNFTHREIFAELSGCVQGRKSYQQYNTFYSSIDFVRRFCNTAKRERENLGKLCRVFPIWTSDAIFF